MLSPHRIVSIVTLLLIIPIFLMSGSSLGGFYTSAGVLVFLYLTVEFIGAYFIGLNFHLKSVNNGDKSKKTVLLTFDDGPCSPQTERVLDVLKDHNVKATFFLIGKNIRGNEHVVKRICAEGHGIGSHTFSHDYWIDVWGKKKLEEDIRKSLDAIENAGGRKINMLRPPYGVTTPNFAYVIKKLNLTSIGWNVRSYDTSTSDINKVFERIMSRTKNGSIILLHDRLDQMPALLAKLIPALKEKGFQFDTINKHEI